MNHINLFISYSHDDKIFKENLLKHLSGLKQNGLIQHWHDKEIIPGTEWSKEIINKLLTADVILFIVTANLMHSNFINRVEITKAFEQHKLKKLIIVPVIAKPCDFESLAISKFLALPEDGKAITTWDNEDSAYLNIVKGLKKIITDFNKTNNSDNKSSFNNLNQIILSISNILPFFDSYKIISKSYLSQLEFNLTQLTDNNIIDIKKKQIILKHIDHYNKLSRKPGTSDIIQKYLNESNLISIISEISKFKDK